MPRAGAPSSIWIQGGVAPCGSAERVGSGPVRRNDSKTTPVPTLGEMIAQWHPGLIIVGEGDTMGGYGQPHFPEGWVSGEITALTSRIQAFNVPCVWIGPGWGTEGGPYLKTYARVREASDFLATHVSPCRYIDSLKFAQPGEWSTFDGQHYTRSGYQQWGAAIDRAILALAQTR